MSSQKWVLLSTYSFELLAMHSKEVRMNFLLILFKIVLFQISNCSINEFIYEVLPKKQGLLTVSLSTLSYFERNLLKCSSSCLRERNCTSFKYNKLTNQCVFLTHVCGFSSTINTKEILARPVSYFTL